MDLVSIKSSSSIAKKLWNGVYFFGLGGLITGPETSENFLIPEAECNDGDAGTRGERGSGVLDLFDLLSDSPEGDFGSSKFC